MTKRSLWALPLFQNGFYCCVGLALILMIRSLVPPPIYAPKGIALPLVAISNTKTDLRDIRLREPLALRGKTAIARINIENHYQQLSEEKLAETTQFAKYLASTVGATEIAVSLLGYVPPAQSDQALLLYRFSGLALR